MCLAVTQIEIHIGWFSLTSPFYCALCVLGVTGFLIALLSQLLPVTKLQAPR